ncbi:MAG: Asp-tRNA(Asn)/Glu-tRNA(Gln) amidotransferase subunit GatA [Bdellovibrionales bacterium]|nr:Asp-tRNA(Asn)/Glu-tRNA(Gln) amidotransferase subunit GatA [Bdellovibrionales bacterium]
MDFFSLCSLQKKLQSSEVSPKEVFDFYLKRIEKYNPCLNAFISWKKIPSFKKKGRLAGIPIGVKDLFCTKDLRTTAGSKGLEQYLPPYTATAVEKLEQEGAIIIGKCNNDEFGMGSTGEHSYFGASKNPWNEKHSPGGSSSGSASAVSARLCPASLGTDTGGSVRLPANYCHLVGLKPTYGRVSRYGMIAYASSLDQAGIFTHTVEDSALLLDVMSGFDSKDSTSLKTKPPYFQKNLSSEIKNKTLAYFDLEPFKNEMNPEIVSAYQKALKLLEQRGCCLIEKKIPFLDYGISAYYLISTSEASSNLSRYDGIRYGKQSLKSSQSLQEFYSLNRLDFFGKEVRRRILIGTFSLSSGYYEDYFHKACQVRYLIKQAFDEIFSSCEAIISPVSKNTAPLLNSKKTEGKNLSFYLNDIFTVFANLIGSPALSLPCSFSKDKLPIGLQLIGPALGEQKILNVALALEEDLNIFEKSPEKYK